MLNRPLEGLMNAMTVARCATPGCNRETFSLRDPRCVVCFVRAKMVPVERKIWNHPYTGQHGHSCVLCGDKH